MWSSGSLPVFQVHFAEIISAAFLPRAWCWGEVGSPRNTYAEIQLLYHSCIKLVGHRLAWSFPLWNDCPWINKVAHYNQVCPSLVQPRNQCCHQAWTKRAYPLTASMKANLRSCIVTISWNKFTELQQLRLLFNGFHHSGLSRLWQRRKMAGSWSFGPSWIPSMTSIHTWVQKLTLALPWKINYSYSEWTIVMEHHHCTDTNGSLDF